MESPESRIAPSTEPESDDSASPLNLDPAAAADALDFEPVPLRYRSDGLTPEKQRAYVEALADTGVAREAAARIGVSEQAISRVRRRRDARAFDRACEAAHLFGARRLRSIAYERAIEGILKGHYYHGELVSQERVYDNRLLTYLLGKTEHLLEPPKEARAVCDDWQPYMEALEQGLEPPDLARPEAPATASGVGARHDESEEDDDPQVWLEDGVWWTFFPPPEAFDGDELGELGDEDYQRTLTDEEEAAIRARRRRETAERLERCCAIRDRFFGLAPRGAPGLSSPRQAETSETSEPDPDPIEFKSAVPPIPRAALSAGTVHAEARRHRGTSPPTPSRAAPPATAESDFLSGFAVGAAATRPLRASAPPREPCSGRGERNRRTFPRPRPVPR